MTEKRIMIDQIYAGTASLRGRFLYAKSQPLVTVRLNFQKTCSIWQGDVI